MLKFFALLRLNPALARLSAVQLICYFGAWFSHTAIFTLLIELEAPVWAITAVAAMAFIPNVLLAPINGIIIDKFAKKPMMTLLMSVESLTVLMLLLVDDLSYLWLLLILVFVRMGVGVTYFQAEMSLLPLIVDKHHLKVANEIHAIIYALSYTAGMGISGLFVHFIGIKPSFVFDFGLYCIGLYLLWVLKVNEPRLNQLSQSALKMSIEGLKYIKQNPKIFHLIMLHGFAAISVYDTIVALLAAHPYKGILSTALTIGFLNMARAFALVIGPLFLSRYTNTKSMFWLFIAQGVGLFIWAISQASFIASFGGIFIAAFFITSIWSFTFTCLQQACEPRFYGRVIAYNDMVYFIVASVVSSGIGFLYDMGLALWGVSALLGVLFIIGGIYWRFVSIKYLQNT